MTPERIRQQREDLLSNLETQGTLPNEFRVTVVGVSFTDGYPDKFFRLEEMNMNAMFNDEQIPCVLIRNKNNEHDKWAIEVHVPSLGDNGMVGHITRPIAARLAPQLDDGIIWTAYVDTVRVSPDHPNRPGLEIHLTRKGRNG